MPSLLIEEKCRYYFYYYPYLISPLPTTTNLRTASFSDSANLYHYALDNLPLPTLPSRLRTKRTERMNESETVKKYLAIKGAYLLSKRNEKPNETEKTSGTITIVFYFTI